jgi:hypothetical protein
MERSVQFTFKIYSLNQTEHLRAWERLNFLTSLTYPQSINRTYTTPPFLKFTLGDWYKNKECFIESLSYTVDDNTPWDIQTDGYKLPTIIEASITLKFVESVGSIFRNEEVEETVDGKTKKVSKLVMNRLYGFGSQKESVENEQQKSTNLNADSSAKPENTTVENKQVADGNSEKKVENPVKETPPVLKPPTIRIDVFGTKETGFSVNYFDTANNTAINDAYNKYVGTFGFNQLEGKEAVFADAKRKAERGFGLTYVKDGKFVPATTNVVKGL